jgi:hypothetical protein
VQPAPLRGFGALAVPEQVHGVTGLAPAAPHSPPPNSDGDGLPPGELVRWHRGACPGRMMVLSRLMSGHLMPARWSRRARAGRLRARRTPFECGADPRARRTSLEGGAPPRSGRNPPEGGAHPRARRYLIRGSLQVGRLVGRRGLRGVGHVLHG